MLIDSHAHLNLKDYFKDTIDLHHNMLNNLVEAAVVVGIDLETSHYALDMEEPWIFATAGIHPQSDNFDDSNQESWSQLETLLQYPQCYAIGETGMDFYHDRVDRETQKKRFIRHLDLAKKYDLPVVVHCRDAEEAVMDVLHSYGQDTRGVLHCWAGGVPLAFLAIEMSWYVSLAGNITFKNASQLREAVSKLPTNRFLVETDCPFLTPHPHRGQINSPALLNLTVQALSSITGQSTQELMVSTRNNTIDLFALPLKKLSNKDI